PGQVSTLCLPLFIAGGEQERTFAQNHPTISVDGCSKCCAKRAIEKYSNAVAGAIDIETLMGSQIALNEHALSIKNLTPEEFEYADKVADEICKMFDTL
ncbi:MAG: putative zinc-binding protein, partial [Eubacterium sp.]